MARFLLEDPFFYKNAEPWDGETFYAVGSHLTYPPCLPTTGAFIPSNSASERTPVVGQFTEHPLGFTFEELCKLIYRAKYIKVDFKVDSDVWYFQEMSPPPEWVKDRTDVIDPVIDGSDLDSAYTDPEHEGGEVYQRHWVHADYPDDPYEYFFYDIIARTETDLICGLPERHFDGFIWFYEWQIRVDFTNILFHDNLYYPKIFMGIATPYLGRYFGFSSVQHPDYMGDEAVIEIDGTIQTTPLSTYTAEVFGKTLNLRGPTGTTSNDPSVYIGEIPLIKPVEIKIEVAKYWPYEDENGNPKFDSDTGELV
jgi:hypothetical protein